MARGRSGNHRGLLVRNAIAAVLPLVSIAASADAAPPQRELTVGQDSSAFRKEFEQRTKNRFAPLAISTHYSLRGRILVSTVWEKRTGGRFLLKAGIKRGEMQKLIAKNGDDGFRLQHMTGSGSGGRETYTAIWDKAPGQRLAVRYGCTKGELLKRHAEFTGRKYAIHRIMAVESSGRIRFTAVWEADVPHKRELQAGIPESAFARQARRRTKNDFRLLQAFGYVEGRSPKIACIWEKSTGPEQEIHARLSETAVKDLDRKLAAKGFAPAFVNGYAVAGRDRYIVVWEKRKD